MEFFTKSLPEFLAKHLKGVYILIPTLVAFLLIFYIYLISDGHPNSALLIAAVLGVFMAMSIGANNIANNIGPAVGSKAITLLNAILLAALFESLGVIIAGGDVIDTIKGGIIDGKQIIDTTIFINIMLATLIGACIWIIIATFSKAPVSATHSVIGALIGAGVTATTSSIVEWGKIGIIAISWIASPIMGGFISVIIVLAIRKSIIKQKARGDAAKKWVPVYISFMGTIFTLYLIQKGLKPLIISNEFLGNILNIKFSIILSIILGIITFFSIKKYYDKKSAFFKNSKRFINNLFNVPLIFAVCLLCFAHGANDVANAIGPLAAINETIFTNNIGSTGASIPFWIMIIGAMGIALGVLVFGSRLVNTVGNDITKLNQSKAFAIALSTAFTVLLASAWGLPVSSTHIALGGIFGVGIYKERLKRLKGKEKEYIEKSIIKKIVLAWIITFPCSAVIASMMYLEFQRFL